MKKIDLSIFPTEMLETLKNEIKKELILRRKSHCEKQKEKCLSFLKKEKPSNISDALKLFFKSNSKYLLDIPKIKNSEPSKLILYLPCLLDQDWSELYPRETDHGEYYVYAHVDPRTPQFKATIDGGGNYGGQPFYIGKGIGNRAFDLKRNQGHGKIIREILNDGYDTSDIVKILFSELSEQKALEIESKLIYYFGIRYSKKRKGWLINLSEPLIPKFIGEMNKIPGRMIFREEKLSKSSNPPSTI